MKSFFQRIHDSQSGASRSASKDPYNVRVPPTQLDSERSRPKTATGHSEIVGPGSSARRHGDGKYETSSRTHRPTDAYATSYPYATMPSTSKPPYTSSQPPAASNPVAQAHPQSYAQTSSRPQPHRPQPEVYDPRTQLLKRNAVAPSPQSSFERVSGNEDGAKVSRHGRSRTGQVPTIPSAPTPEMWIPPPQQPSYPSRRQKEDDKGKEVYGERDKDAPERHRHKERDRGKERDKEKERDRDRERDRAKERAKGMEREWQRSKEGVEGKSRERERDRTRDRENLDRDGRKEHKSEPPLHREHRTMPRSSARDLNDPRVEEGDSSDGSRRKPVAALSGHRRHRKEEGTATAPSARKPYHEPSPLATSAVAPPLDIPLQPTVASSSSEPRGPSIPPPTPRAMPVHLPAKEAKPQKSHHDKTVLAPIDVPQGALSGSDTERAKRRELRHRTTNHASNLRGHHREIAAQLPETKPSSSSSKPQTGYDERSCEPTTRTDKKFSESRGLSAGRPFSRSGESPPQNLADTRPDIQLGASAVAALPTDKVRRESTAQFVSIRAGQGPSDPPTYDILYKASVSLHPDTLSTSARPENQDRTHAHDVPPRPDAMPPLHSRSQVYKNPESEYGRSPMPYTVENPFQPATSGYGTHSREQDTRPVVTTTASQQAASAPLPSRPAVYNHNLNDNRPTAPQSTQAPVIGSDLHSTIPPSPAQLNLPSVTQVGQSGTTSYPVKSTESQSSGTPLTRGTEPSSVTLSQAWRPQTSTSRSYYPSESEGRSPELPAVTQTAGGPQSFTTPVIPPTTPSRAMPSRGDRNEVHHTDRPLVNQTPPNNVSSQPQTARHPTFQVPPLQQTSSSSKILSMPANMNGMRTETTVHASLTATTALRDPVDRNVGSLNNATASQSVQTSNYHAKPFEPPLIAVGPKQDSQGRNAVPQIYTSALTTANTVNDNTRISEVHSPAPTRVSQLIASFEGRAPITANVPQLAAGLSVQRPATALATKREAVEKASVPQIYATAPQIVSASSYCQPSEGPKREAVEKDSVPQIYITPPQIAPPASFGQSSEARVLLPANALSGLSVPRPSTAMGSMGDIAEKSLAPQISSMAPQIASGTSYDQAKSSMNTAPFNVGFAMQRPLTTASGSQREVGERTRAPQLYAESQVALGESHNRTIPVNSSHLHSIPSDQRSSITLARGNVESPAAPQIRVTPSQAAPGTSHDHTKSSESRPAAPTNAFPVNAGQSMSRTSTAMVSTQEVVEKVRAPQIYALAPAIAPGISYDHIKPPPAELVPVAKAPQLRVGSSILDSKANLPVPHAVPQVSAAVSQPQKLSYENGKPSEMRPHDDAEAHSAVPPQLNMGSSTQPSLRLQQTHSERHAVPQPSVSSSQIPPITQGKLSEARSIPGNAPHLNVASASQPASANMDSKPQWNPIPQISTPPASKTPFHHPKLAEILSPHTPSTVSQTVAGLSSRFPVDEAQQGNLSNPSQMAVYLSHDTTSRPLVIEPPASLAPLPASIQTNDLSGAGQPQLPPSTNLTSKLPSPTAKTLHYRSSSSKLHSQTTPSPTHPTATPPLRLSPSHIAKSSDIRSAGQSHTPAILDTVLQHSPHVPSSNIALKEPFRISPAPAPQHTPDPISKPLTHRTSSHNMHSHIYSRPNEPQTLSRTTQHQPSSSYPSALHRLESRTPYLEAPPAAHAPNVANPRTFDSYQYETRVTSQHSSQPQTSMIPGTSGSRAYENTKTPRPSHPNPTITPSSSSSRPHPKSYEPLPQRTQRIDSSRNRELQSTVSSNIVANPPQPDPNPHRSGISASNNAPSYQSSTRHQHSVSLPTSNVPPPTQPVASESTRTHANPPTRSNAIPTNNSQPITPYTTSASTRAPVSTAAAPSRAPQKIHSVPSEESILKTPSSLAPSMLKPTTSRSSIPDSVSLQQDSRKKSGIFGMFRSKTPEQPQPKYEIWHPPTSTKVHHRNDLPSKTEPSAKLGTSSDRKVVASLSSRGKVPLPITVPIPIPPASGRKSPGNKVFTPFRYLTSKRNRTMSAASVEAVDGTAPNTVVGSPTVSMHSQTPLQPPPLRDPLVATQEWRNQEEAAMRGRGSGRPRRQRPGVVFDVSEEPAEDKQRLRPTRPRTPAQAGPSRSG